MDKYIKANRLTKELQSFILSFGLPPDSYASGLQRAKIIIERQPAADVQEVKHAHWILKSYYTVEGICLENVICCSNCGIEYNREMVRDLLDSDKVFDYCPYCGAKMDEKGE